MTSTARFLTLAKEKCPVPGDSNVLGVEEQNQGGAFGGPLAGSERFLREGEVSMSLIRACLLGLAAQIAVSVSAMAQSSQTAGSQTPPLMDRQKEIALALSACPSSVSSKAAVYVLNKSGYVQVRESQSGFTAIVQHSLLTSQEPQCMDAEGTRTFLPRMLKVAELRAQGKSPDEIKRVVADAFAKGVFPAPTRPGVIYMLSAENLVPDDKGIVGPFAPHVMFYGTHLTNADIGSEGQAGGGPAFVVNDGAPHSLIIVPIGTHTGASHAPADKRSENPQ
jgi:hypothetical protein